MKTLAKFAAAVVVAAGVSAGVFTAPAAADTHHGAATTAIHQSSERVVDSGWEL